MESWLEVWITILSGLQNNKIEGYSAMNKNNDRKPEKTEKAP